jgi:hypothetical protein
MRRLQLLYTLGCTLWAAYLIRVLASAHRSHPEATLSGALLCVLELVVLPTLLGYFVLFRVFPWVGRLLMRR